MKITDRIYFNAFPDGIVLPTKYRPVAKIYYWVDELLHFQIIYYHLCGVKHYQNQTKRLKELLSKLYFSLQLTTFYSSVILN